MNAIVIGAGVGGIAAAIRTARLGYRVDVYEAAAGPGGKLSAFERDGYRFDRGPSLFTMPHYVDELFRLCGEEPADHFRYRREEVVCRYFWDDGTRLCAYADPARFSREAADVLGVAPALVSRALAAAQRKYAVGGRTFLERPLHRLSTWTSPEVARALARVADMGLADTMHGVNERLLAHPKLVQLFDRFATYNGSDPYRAPGILTVIPTFEHVVGTYLPEGGMVDIAASLVALAERQGVRFHYGTPVRRVLRAGRRVSGVALADGGRRACDVLVCNADVHGFYRSLMPAAAPPERVLRQERSTSALIFYWGLRGDHDALGLHNIFFGRDYAAEFAALRAGRIADDFTVYVNVTSKHIRGEAPPGRENWFVMVNAPHDRGQDWDAELARIRRLTLAKLGDALDVDLAAALETEATWTPPGIAADTGSHLGALYGTSSNNPLAAFLRHRNQSREFANLFFVGGSVHPGGGVPLALLSARIAGQLIAEARAGRRLPHAPVDGAPAPRPTDGNALATP